MEDTDKFKTVEKQSEGVFKEKGSKFFAFAYPVTTETEVKEILKDLRKKYFDARHHVYAFRLGANLKTYRCSDDGEPSNSSGPPVLGQIQSQGLTNILIVVVRYFGGTKLGVAGLINAYRSAAADALANNAIIEKFELDVFTLSFGYAVLNDVMKIIKEENPDVLSQQFDNTCQIKLACRKLQTLKLQTMLCKIDGATII